jgi:HPt (histidine-containing phosphotransfer) domain-containing protein
MLNQDTPLDEAVDPVKQVIYLDSEIGLKYYDDCWDYYKEAVEIFEDRLHALVNELYAVQMVNNLEQIRVLTHSLSGIAGLVGAIPLQASAKKIELLIQHQQIEGLDGLLEELIRVIKHTQLAAKNILQN